MRLTLRSLLGYLDDILEPQQTKELGEKISESSFAAGLVARIREVVRRRRITAPEVSGPGSDPDPNLVAEYLDNTLPPDKVEDLERLCLDSDVHLAEVAGSHQILTMVLGEPVEVPQATRERMYALGAVQNGTTSARTTPVSSAASAPPMPSPQPEVPEYLSGGVAWRQVLPAAAALLVLGVWLGLIFSDPTMKSWRFWEPTDHVAVVQSDAAPVEVDGPAPGDAVDAPPPQGAHVAVNDSTIVAAASPARPIADLPPLPPVSSSVPPVTSPLAERDASGATSTATSVSPTVPPTAMPAAAAASTAITPAPAVVVEASNITPAQPPVAAAAPAIPVAETRLLYNGTAGVLLSRDPTEGWLVLPRRTLLHVGDDIASPEPFESSLQILDSDCEIVLSGGGRVVILPPTETVRAAIQVDRGRLVFRRQASAALADASPILVRIDDLQFTLELLTPGGECGLEITRHMSAGPLDRVQSLSFDGVVSITSGTARIRLEDGTVFTSEPSPATLSIVSGQLSTTPQPLLTPPAWMTPLTGGAAVVAQQSARQFEDQFQLGTPIDATVPSLIEDRYPRHSELATKTLVLLDEVPEMVRALSAPHQESRIAALIGLGSWIRRDPGNALRLSEELGRQFDAEPAARMQRLIWGFAPADAQQPDAARQLVEWLGDANIAVREGAFFHILRLTGGQMTFSYHPDRTESQRAASVKRWESHVQKLGGLIEPSNPLPVPSEN